jgi:hypothetical protein
MGLNAHERETVIVFNDGDDMATISTSQRRVITQLKKTPSATLADEGVFERSPWARFELPKGFVSFRSKIRVLSEQERTRRAAQLRRTNRMRVPVQNADPDRNV